MFKALEWPGLCEVEWKCALSRLQVERDHMQLFALTNGHYVAFSPYSQFSAVTLPTFRETGAAMSRN